MSTIRLHPIIYLLFLLFYDTTTIINKTKSFFFWIYNIMTYIGSTIVFLQIKKKAISFDLEPDILEHVRHQHGSK